MNHGSAPIRCPACLGTGGSQTVMTGKRTYVEPCCPCAGTGRLVTVRRFGCLALPLESPLRLRLP